MTHTFVRAAGSAVGTLALAMVLTSALVPRAQAADAKFNSATECQPFLPTTYETAVFKDNAVYNPTNANQRVICPVNKDAFDDWTAGNVGFEFYIKAGATPGKVSCTLYGGGAIYGAAQVAYTATSSTISPGNTGFASITGIQDPASDFTMEGWNLLCTLNAGMSLGGYWINEDYATDDEGA